MAQNPHSFRGVVFDLDGTLADTESLCNTAGVAAFAARGEQVPIAFFESLSGIDDTTRLLRLGTFVGDRHDPDEMMADWYDRFAVALDAGVPLKPGALDLLEHTRSTGLPMALATSSQRPHARLKLARAGIEEFFGIVVTVEDVARPKPAPDAYLLAARHLGFAPGECLAFEDSDTGAQSARDAGMRVVQVPDGPGPTGIHAHHLAPTLLDGARLAGFLA